MSDPQRPDLDACREHARMTNFHKEADVLALCDYIEHLEALRKDLARENYAALQWLHELTGVSADALRATLDSRTRPNPPS